MKDDNKIRTINELLTILRDKASVDENNLIEAGLCNEVRKLFVCKLITHGEKIKLFNHIDEYKPHYIIPTGLNYINGEYYSQRGFGWLPQLWQPRLKWLNKHIKRTN